jgi:superfamily II DNA helicase RecQ
VTIHGSGNGFTDWVCSLCAGTSAMKSQLCLYVPVCRVEYKNLSRTLRASVGKVPIFAFTTTATAETINTVQKCLNMQSHTVVRGPLFRPNLYLAVAVKAQSNMQLAQLQHTLQSSESLAVVLCKRERDRNVLCTRVQTNFPDCRLATFHTDLKAAVREPILQWCRGSQIDALFCTTAFGLGIDVTVRTVIHWDVPQSMCHYVQEIGRAGRDGHPSVCRMSVTADWYEKRCKLAYKDVSNVARRIDESRELQTYISCEGCRHEYLLQYNT